MRVRRWRLLLTHYGRKRRRLRRIVFLFAFMFALGLSALLWSSLLQASITGVGRDGREDQHPWSTFSSGVGKAGVAEGGRKLPHHGPFSPEQGPPPPLGKSLGEVQVWFHPKAGKDQNENGNVPGGWLQSAGRIRMALPFSVDVHTGGFVPKLPRLFAFVAPWSDYARMLREQGAGKEEIAVAAAEAEEEKSRPSPLSKARWEPVKHLEVRLLRQRASRQTWVVESEGKEPIIGVVPRESTTLISADELLVDGNLDSQTEVPAAAVVQQDSCTATESHFDLTAAVGIDSEARASAALRQYSEAKDRNSSAALLLPSPLVALCSVPRTSVVGSIAAETQPAAVHSRSTTLLKWRTGRAHRLHRRRAPLQISLDYVYPPQQRINAAGILTSDDSYTAALAATMCSSHIERLYGLSPLLTRQYMTGNNELINAATGMDALNSIPLHMPEGVELAVGGTEPRLAGKRFSGVVPLLYVQLSSNISPHNQSEQWHRSQTVGLMWLHPAPVVLSTFTTEGSSANLAKSVHCVRLRGTSGATGLYLLPGPTPADVLRQYYTLTGFPTLPPRFLLGYHHGVRGKTTTSASATEALSEVFRQERLPLDSIWLTDAAISERDTPFTWNHTLFPEPLIMQANLWHRGRRYIVVRSIPTVPVTTRSPLYREGRKNAFFVTTSADTTTAWHTCSADGVPSHVIDFANPAARKWYGSMLKYRRYVGSSNHTFVALQHSVPTVLGSPTIMTAEATSLCQANGTLAGDALLPMDVGHYGAVPHRHVHQLLPLQMMEAAHDGLLRRTRYHRRALVFTENYFAGTQRFGVVQVETSPTCSVSAFSSTRAVLDEGWRQLEWAVHQCAQLGTLGIPYNGANMAGDLAPRVAALMRMERDVHNSSYLSSAAEVQRMSGLQTRSGDSDEAEGSTGTPSAPHLGGASVTREAEQLVMRWYQAGALFAAMYAVEPAEHEFDKGLEERVDTQGATQQPWWMRLPLLPAAKKAIRANLYVRYALVPYIYTMAYHTSEDGALFVVPLRYAEDRVASPAALIDAENSSSFVCYAVGRALVACPVTRLASTLDVGTIVESEVGEGVDGYFDFWTGVWHPLSSVGMDQHSWWGRKGTEVSAMERHRSAASLAWLATAEDADPSDLPTGHELAPVLLRTGHIVMTQNIIPASSSHSPPEALLQQQSTTANTADSAPKDEALPIHSTHMGANWTLTVALPPLPPLQDGPPSPPLLLAEGDLFWDEGSIHSPTHSFNASIGDVQPPHSDSVPPTGHHCKLSIKCFYVSTISATGKSVNQLAVEIAQISSSCANALAELEQHWRHEPQGFAEHLAYAKSRRDARVHQYEMKMDALEDKGLRRARGAMSITGDDLGLTKHDLHGLLLPEQEVEDARNTLLNAYHLQRIRFLFQRGRDANRLRGEPLQADAFQTVAVERRSRTGVNADSERSEEDVARAHARVSRNLSRSNAVLVHLSSLYRWTAETGAMQKTRATPVFVFGTQNEVHADGSISFQVPQRHTWRFTFSLTEGS